MERWDLVICGGGVAGLTLARQLSLRLPQLRVLVLETATRPLPVAAHKVGESAVETSAHYLLSVLQLDELVRATQLPKVGLRFWLGAGSRGALGRVEYGPKHPGVVPSLHIDRGTFESSLRELISGWATLREGCVVDNIEIDAENGHTVRYRDRMSGVTHTVMSKWVVDTTGRRRMLQTKLGHATPSDHSCSSAWWRVEGIIDMDRWLGAEADVPPRRLHVQRWLATNHLMGEGYWVWLIPLSSNHTSVGIVADQRLHPIAQYNSYERALEWLDRHEPELAALLRDKSQRPILDFLALKNFSHWSKRVVSAQRWACSGDAGIFADPLYSPGGDTIAVANTAICELIQLDQRGALSDEAADAYNEFIVHDYGLHVLDLYRHNYKVFGDPLITVAKTHWDTCSVWAFPCALFFQGHMGVEEIKQYGPIGRKVVRLNAAVQKLFRDWYDRRARPRDLGGRFVPYSSMPLFRELQRELVVTRSAQELFAEMRERLPLFEDWANVLFREALRDCFPDEAISPDLGVDPYTMDLSKWPERQELSTPNRRDTRGIEAQTLQHIVQPCF